MIPLLYGGAWAEYSTAQLHGLADGSNQYNTRTIDAGRRTSPRPEPAKYDGSCRLKPESADQMTDSALTRGAQPAGCARPLRTRCGC